MKPPPRGRSSARKRTYSGPCSCSARPRRDRPRPDHPAAEDAAASTRRPSVRSRSKRSSLLPRTARCRAYRPDGHAFSLLKAARCKRVPWRRRGRAAPTPPFSRAVIRPGGKAAQPQKRPSPQPWPRGWRSRQGPEADRQPAWPRAPDCLS